MLISCLYIFTGALVFAGKVAAHGQVGLDLTARPMMRSDFE